MDVLRAEAGRFCVAASSLIRSSTRRRQRTFLRLERYAASGPYDHADKQQADTGMETTWRATPVRRNRRGG